MSKLLNIVTPLHRKTARDYIGRMMDDKVTCMITAKKFEYDFWDGERRYGYGGYKYDGRWKVVAESLINLYQLPENAKILDIGCGKGHLLLEFKKLLPNCEVYGTDVSKHALSEAPEEVKSELILHNAKDPLPFSNQYFDLALSINTLHNLRLHELKTALSEMNRVGKNKYLLVESYRNEQELFNVQCWGLTCQSFFDPEEWLWMYKEFGYQGDYEFIYME